MKERNIEAVVFDLEGLYFENGVHKFTDTLQEYGVSPENIRRLYLQSPEMKAYKRGKLHGLTFWSYVIFMMDLPTTPKELLQKLVDGYEENPAAVEWIKDLRNDGIKIGACSNTFKERIELLEEKFGFKKNFDIFVVSYEEGILKPDPKIFMRLSERLHIAPERILFSDDKGENIVASHNLGFKTALYKNIEELKTRYEELQRR